MIKRVNRSIWGDCDAWDFTTNSLYLRILHYKGSADNPWLVQCALKSEWWVHNAVFECYGPTRREAFAKCREQIKKWINVQREGYAAFEYCADRFRTG